MGAYEPGQVRKEAAVSRMSHVPGCTWPPNMNLQNTLFEANLRSQAGCFFGSWEENFRTPRNDYIIRIFRYSFGGWCRDARQQAMDATIFNRED
jgi:hypothetical protein